ncbi:NUDIX domain-containing protein [Streptomyces cyaneofuscatus]|uniref:NUDIX domain-containing protein n=1 Tax=Streptomyces cyaneofuscatus TaxID=66883 RepID=UPI00366A26D0
MFRPTPSRWRTSGCSWPACRTRHRSSRPGCGICRAGGIDPGEQPVEALVRELWEETGLELVPARLLAPSP